MQFWRYPVILVAILLLFFSYLHSAPHFADPDSFYHARITALMLEQKSYIKEFPWLPLTSLADSYIDHHLLYHLFLLPFVALFGPLWGIKVATTLAAGVVLFVFWILLDRCVPLSTSRKKAILVTVFTASLVFNELFLLRVNLEKIPALGMLWLFAGIYAIISHRVKHLFFLSFFYVWLHSGWPLLPLVSLVGYASYGFGKKYVWIPIASFTGAFAGLIINPYFPTNLSFYLVQIYHIAIITYRDLIPIGAEWYPLGFQLIPKSIIAILGLVVGSIAFLAREVFAHDREETRRSPQEWFLFFLSLTLLALTIKSARHAEYFVPIATLFSGVICIPLLGHISISDIKKKMLAFVAKGFAPTFGAALFCSLFLLTLLFSVRTVASTLTQKNTQTSLQELAVWLSRHTPPRSIVFNDRWDLFPALLYYNQNNRYVSGLDPTFLYIKNPENYWLYCALSGGAIQKNTASLIQKNFHADTIIVVKENSALRTVLEKDPAVTKSFENSKAIIYSFTAGSSQK